MKTRVRWQWSLGLVLAALAIAGRYAQAGTAEPASNNPELGADKAAASATSKAPNPSGGSTGGETNLADAAFQPISPEKPLPANVRPAAPVTEVIRLAQAGVEEQVMLAYITNSARPFNLTPDDIIYLNDIGVPASVVTAMIQRDQVLKGVAASNPEPSPAAPAPVAPPEQFAPVPEGPAPDMAQSPTDEMPPEPPAPADYGPVGSSLQPPDDGSYSTFYDSLAPYGTWVNVAGYGPCWQPTVVVGNPYWQPYCNGGHWVYTDCGWYWLSSYSWGWAPFHYGRWFHHNHLGWCWAPDSMWGPSWVSWRYSASYCAWAPLPPGAWYRPGIGLTYRGQPVGNGFGFGLSARSFAIVPFNHFYDHHLAQYTLPQRQATHVLNTLVVSSSILRSNNRIINNGLPPARVTASTGTQIHRLSVKDSYAPIVQGVRAERLEGAGTALAVSRPNSLPHTGGYPAAAGWANGNAGNDAGKGTPHYATTYSGQPSVNNGRTIITEINPGNGYGVGRQQTPASGRSFNSSNGRDLRETAISGQYSTSSGQAYQGPPGQVTAPALPRPSWSAPSAPIVDQHYVAPAYHPPEVPRAAPAPTYSAPAPPPPRPEPAYSPPPAPAAPVHSGSEKHGR